MINNLKVVLFDIDDTLFDRRKAQKEILHLIIEEYDDIFTGIGEEMITDAFFQSDSLAEQEFNEDTSTDVFRKRRSLRFLKTLGLSEKLAEEITTMYIKSYYTVGSQVRDAKYVVENLAEKFKLGVVSNGFPDVQYQKLKTIGIRHLFHCIVLSGEVCIMKPAPEIFWMANNSLDNKPEECLYVGDSYNIDIIGAKKARMYTCWFNPDGLYHLDINTKPDYEIKKLNEILQILNCV
ncbi:HAD family hydrolase [candidate division WOR-3 bacterium]|nr:HAD family hydrolase [candidate division WOR-3 bacterium]